MNDKVIIAANAVESMVNTFGIDSVATEFVSEMDRKHRTLQQAFTKVALRWIEHVASDSYRTDGRNKGSHEVCKEMIGLFRESKGKDFDEYSLDIMGKPSAYCHMI